MRKREPPRLFHRINPMDGGHIWLVWLPTGAAFRRVDYPDGRREYWKRPPGDGRAKFRGIGRNHTRAIACIDRQIARLPVDGKGAP